MRKGGLYRYYVLMLLMLTMTFSITDRLVMSILIEDIKAEFAFSDGQIGLLTGFAFTLFYVVLGVPIARLADRSNRTVIVSVSLTLWSVMTALCGAAAGFWTMFLARIGVGIGEAGGVPPSVSIIADYFKPTELAKAMAIFSMGATIGASGGYIAGGFLADAFGWRMTFVLVGLPGVALGLLMLLTVKEPERGRFVKAARKDGVIEGQAPFAATVRSLMTNKIYMRVIIANALAIASSYAFTVWIPAVLLRNFELETSQVGLILGITIIVTGLPGLLLGGMLTDYMAQKNEKWRCWLQVITLLIALPLWSICMFVGGLPMLILLYGLGYGFFIATQGPAVSLIQLSAKPSERAAASAFGTICTNILGFAVGVPLTGFLSDFLAPQLGSMSLNYALVAITLATMIPAAIFYYWTAQAMDKDKTGRAAAAPSTA